NFLLDAGEGRRAARRHRTRDRRRVAVHHTDQDVHPYFESTRGIYEDDTVRVLGVQVGTITDITSEAGQSRVTMEVDEDCSIPEDANPLLVAQSLVAERFIQLVPSHTGGPTLAEGDEIPLERTAVPVEWDGVKDQLMKLSSALVLDEGEETRP